MKDYSIIFNNINEDKNIFYYQINSNFSKNVIISVYNSFLKHKEYEEELKLSPKINYWTYIPSNNKNRYVEFRDKNTYDIVGMFGLDGKYDLETNENGMYVKSIFEKSSDGEKTNLYSVLNEITCKNIYHNKFVNVEKGDVVFDIGFNYGLFSLESLKSQPSRIVAFEPNPKLIQTFKEFFTNSPIEIHQKAVTNRNGKIVFYENIIPGMSSIFQEMNNIGNTNSYEVETINFKTFLSENNIQKIDYLKIDCEGAEYEIIDSIKENLIKIRKIAIELHHSLENPKVQTLINTLKESGFDVKVNYEINVTIGKNFNQGMVYGKR